MGYVRTLKRFLNFINNKNYSTDDQRNFNQACKTFQNMIKLDTKQTVFNNLAPHNLERLTSNFTNLDTCFVQLPGEISYDRVIRRGIKEYYPFIKKEVDWIVSLCLAIIFAIVAIIFFIKYFKNNPI
jgi:hypothetical protein